MTTKKQIRDRFETITQFCAQATKYNLPVSTGKIAQDVDWLHRQETSLHAIAEMACNRELTQRETIRQAAIEQRVKLLLNQYVVPVRFEGDPRGGSIRMKFVSGASNNWGGEDWGIYW